MMPSPAPGASHGDPQDHPNEHDDHPDEQAHHLSCRCQRRAPHPRSLCGLAVAVHHPDTRRDVSVDEPVFGGRLITWCVVCEDLARTALVSGRCERCPS